MYSTIGVAAVDNSSNANCCCINENLGAGTWYVWSPYHIYEMDERLVYTQIRA